MSEKYAGSLIDSTISYLEKLQYFAQNNRTTLRALGTLRILHYMYQWVIENNPSEPKLVKIAKLMECLYRNNSNLIRPIVIGGTYYSNVNTPQELHTWQRLYDDQDLIFIENLDPPLPPLTGAITVKVKVRINDIEDLTNTNIFNVVLSDGTNFFPGEVSSTTDYIFQNLPYTEYTLATTGAGAEEYTLTNSIPNPIIIETSNVFQIITLTYDKNIIPTGSISVSVTIDGEKPLIPVFFDFNLSGIIAETVTPFIVSTDEPHIINDLIFDTYTITPISTPGYTMDVLQNCTLDEISPTQICTFNNITLG